MICANYKRMSIVRESISWDGLIKPLSHSKWKPRMLWERERPSHNILFPMAGLILKWRYFNNDIPCKNAVDRCEKKYENYCCKRHITQERKENSNEDIYTCDCAKLRSSWGWIRPSGQVSLALAAERYPEYTARRKAADETYCMLFHSRTYNKPPDDEWKKRTKGKESI